jgi:Zn-dependent metalloprotease
MKRGTKAPPMTRLFFALLAVFLSGLLPLQYAYSATDFQNSGFSGMPADNSAVDADVESEEGEQAGSLEIISGGSIPAVQTSGEINLADKAAQALAVQTGFDTFNASHQGQWKATFNKQGGKVKTLYGAVSKRYDNGPENVAVAFLKDSYAMFGLKHDLSDLVTQKVHETPAMNHVRLQQTYNGIPIAGAFVLVHSNSKGQVTMVQNGYIEGFQAVNGLLIAADTAKSTARADLESSLGKDASIFDPKAEELVTPYNGKYYVVWKVSIPTKNPWGLWVYHIDAENGAILYKGNEIYSLKNGKGRAYLSNANWHNGKISNVTLKDMYYNTPGYASGFLWGPRVNVIDNNGSDPSAPDYKFLYNPVSQKDAFDATHAYYQMETVSDWWYKQVLKKYGPASPDNFYTYMIPVYVNVHSMCNAYYSATVDGANPGFAFGDQGSCAATSEDLVIDNDVVRHEWTHAMMDWNGFDVQFSSALNYYGRAMGEGNADFFAFLNTPKDPLIGDVAWNWSLAGYLRDLDNTRMYPRDVNLPSTGLPEEHYTGEIWGGYLYDVYRVLKGSALPYVYNSLFHFSATGGFMTSQSDFFDAMYAQIQTEQLLTGKYTNSAKVWGSATARGINALLRSPYSSANYFNSGSAGSDSPYAFWWNFPPVKAINTTSNLLLSGDEHEYVVNVTSGSPKITATVTGKSKGLINPSIYLYNSAGALVEQAQTHTASKAVLTHAGLTPGLYVVMVTGSTTPSSTGPARGYYSFSVSLK